MNSPPLNFFTIGDQLIIGDLKFYFDNKNDTAIRKLAERLESFSIL